MLTSPQLENWPGADVNDTAEQSNTGKAFAMLNAFASIDASVFNITLTDINGDNLRFHQYPDWIRPDPKTKRLPDITLDELRARIGGLLQDATRIRRNVIIRPRSATALLVQLDDFTAEKVAVVAPHAFMTICTSPGNYQVWLAVSDAPKESDKEAAKQFRTRARRGAGADKTASGATRIAGSLNFKTKYAPAFPTIEIIQVDAGRTVTAAALENAGLLAPQEEEPEVPPASVPPSTSAPREQRAGARHWPDYQQSLRGAPLKDDGTPDRSLADFMWCKWAIQRGHGIEETAEKLAEVSAKVQERIRIKGDQGYALLTARNAAKAFERERDRRSGLKRAARP
jgi:RepB DNA-primase from phage plasmid